MAGEQVGFTVLNAPSATGGTTRKRSRDKQDDGELTSAGQQAKRLLLGNDGHLQGGPDAIRKEIRRIYDIQSNLAVSSSPADPSSLLPAYEALLQAATGPYCATRRLAARLIPRFLHLFPHRVDAAAMALMAVYSPKQPARDDLPAIVEAAQADALHGLSTVLDVAYKLVDKAVATVLRLTDFEMRLIYSHVQRGGELASAAADNGPGSSSAVGHAASLLRRPDPEVLQQLVRRTFQLFPRVVISLCLQAFRGSDPVLQVSATWVLQHQLLQSEPSPTLRAADAELQAVKAAAGADDDAVVTANGNAAHAASKASGKEVKVEEAAGNGHSSPADTMSAKKDGTNSQDHGEPATAAATADGHAASVLAEHEQQRQGSPEPTVPALKPDPDAAPPHCLARMVLSELPDTQQWLRTAITAVTKDKKVLPKDAVLLVQQLMSLAAPASPPPQPPASPQPPTTQPDQDGHPAAAAAAAAAGDHVAAGTAAHFVLPPPPQLPPGGQRPDMHPSSRAVTPDDLQGGGPAPPGSGSRGGDMMVLSPPPGPGSMHPHGHLLTPLAVKGGPVTRADCCLYITQLPPALTPASLRAECDRHGAVDSVHLGLPAQLALGEALVVFKSVNDAALCYQALADTPAWGGTRPVRCDFCPGLPADCPMRAREGPSRPAANYVWCASGPPAEHIYTSIQQAGLPLPRTVLRVSGRAPGCLLDMPEPQCVQAIVEFVLQRFMPGTPPPPFLLPASLQPQYSLLSPAASLQPMQSAMSAGLPHSSSAQLGGPQDSMQLQRAPSHHHAAAGHMPPPASPWTSSGGGAGMPPKSQQPPTVQGSPMPPMASGQLHAASVINSALRTLWVGQVHDSISDEQLLASFRRFGELVGWRVLRSSHCAFLDFATHSAAAEAQRVMHGSKLGGHVIRVEWKMDPKMQLQPQPQQQQVPLMHTPSGQGHGLGGPLSSRASMPGHMPPFTPSATPGGPPYPPPPPPPGAGQHSLQGPPMSACSTPAGPGSTPRLHPHHGLAQGYAATPVLLGRRPSLTPNTTIHPQLDMMAGGLGQQGGPAHQQHAAGPPLPSTPSGAAGGGGWQGLLAKSGAPVCTVVCMPAEPSARGSAAEPCGWPPSLDVRMRVDMQYVVGMVWSSTAPHLRAARRLLPASPEVEAARLAEFVRYLSEKQRAGVIKLDTIAAGGMPARTLYLVPPSQQAAQALGLSWEPRRDAAALLAVVVPTPPNAR